MQQKFNSMPLKGKGWVTYFSYSKIFCWESHFFVFTIFSFSFWQLAVLFLAVTSSSSSRLDGQTFQVWRYRISIINTTWFRKSFLCPNLLLYIFSPRSLHHVEHWSLNKAFMNNGCCLMLVRQVIIKYVIKFICFL